MKFIKYILFMLDKFTIAVPFRNRWLPYYTHEHVMKVVPLLSPAVKTPFKLNT